MLILKDIHGEMENYLQSRIVDKEYGCRRDSGRVQMTCSSSNFYIFWRTDSM